MCKRLIYFVFVVAVLFVAAPVGAMLVDWENVVAPASPGFLATDVPDGLYDIGAYGGEQTYEFVVKSNPDETNASMCLIGRRDFGDTQAGLKYEQWNNTGTYGATLFGVVDLDFGVANNPGVDTHLVFVSSETTGTTALYVNGVYQASVDSAVSLSGLIGIGYGAQDEATRGSAYFDDFDGVIYGVAIYDAALSDAEIAAHSFAFFLPEPVDPGSDGLVAYYPLDNDANDASGTNNNGTLSGDPLWVAGYIGDALQFDGIDDHVDCGNDPSLDITGPITIGAWVNPIDAGSSNYPRVVDKSNGTGGADPGYKMYLRSGDGYLMTGSAGGEYNNSTAAANQGEWNYLAFVVTGEQHILYVNGHCDILDINAVPVSSTNPLWLGDGPGGSRPLNGILDEVTIYNRGLSIGEVRYLAGDRLPPVVLFEEDFEGLTLGPNVDEGLAGDAVWTDTPPEGWSVDESGIPGIGDPNTDGVTEWAGWAFADKDWWVETAGDQDRSLFTLGSGIVAIADSDEWDDADRIDTPIADDPYDTWLSTPAIDITSAEAGTVQLKFDSSWRPEFDDNYHQTASITASFDGGDPFEVLLWESDEASPNYKPYATNETIIVDLGNPEGAASVVLTFGLFDAGNDWWWAIDNVQVIKPAPIPEEPDPSLSIHYSFDEVGAVVADQSGKGHDGVVVGDVTAEAEGILAGAAKFANAGYLDLDGLNFSLEDIPTSAITLAAWIKCENNGEHHAIFNARASDQTWVVHPEARSNGEFRWLIRSYGGTTMFDIRAGVVTWDEWEHFAGTYDKETAKATLCINGEFVSELDVAAPADIAGDWGLGARVGKNIDDARPFTGLMDEFRMYTRALSQEEIAGL
ncbi:MAG: hypothetical protein JXM79_08240 [Sedimentisphaerales bacterium]|nr:hypothetical protein [Sedimentisphaerales bacterium]